MALMELNMDDEAFQEWYRDTADLIETPTIARLLEFMETNSRAIVPSRVKTKPVALTPKKPHRAAAYFVQDQRTCSLCQTGSHFLYQCSVFKGQSLEQRSARLEACYNCLRNHNSRLCPSHKSCHECGQCHHSLLHRTRTPAHTSCSA